MKTKDGQKSKPSDNMYRVLPAFPTKTDITITLEKDQEMLVNPIQQLYDYCISPLVAPKTNCGCTMTVTNGMCQQPV
jgi:hypothetical protein